MSGLPPFPPGDVPPPPLPHPPLPPNFSIPPPPLPVGFPPPNFNVPPPVPSQQPVDYTATFSNEIVETLKSNGTFDRLRRQLISEVDTKPAFKNLLGTVERRTSEWLDKLEWPPGKSKAEIREALRTELLGSQNEPSSLSDGIERSLEQVLNKTNVEHLLAPAIEQAVADVLCLSFDSQENTERSQYFSEFLSQVLAEVSF